MKSPFLIFLLSLILLSLSVWVGASFRKRRAIEEDEREDFAIVVGAIWTLLGLLVGFSFSMAVSRYDQRKNYEAEEANAIGTEYVRADLLPATNAAAVHRLLVKYLEQRVRFYTVQSDRELAQISSDTAQLQSELWSEVRSSAAAQPTPPVALAVAGMNHVLDTQGYTQAAWWNRIPIAAWALMSAIAICSNMLIGYTSRRLGIFWILPLAVSIAFLLIADIDTPRRGVIRVVPRNLMSLSQSLHPS
jgi:hypothetical protein